MKRTGIFGAMIVGLALLLPATVANADNRHHRGSGHSHSGWSVSIGGYGGYGSYYSGGPSYYGSSYYGPSYYGPSYGATVYSYPTSYYYPSDGYYYPSGRVYYGSPSFQFYYRH